MHQIYIIRGIPGSGKGDLARKLAGSANVSAMDFVAPGVGFDPNQLPMYHQCCKAHTRWMMIERRPIIAVHNTFTKISYIRPYLALARSHGYRVKIVECIGSSQTDASAQVRSNMAKKWEPIPDLLEEVLM